MMRPCFTASIGMLACVVFDWLLLEFLTGLPAKRCALATSDSASSRFKQLLLLVPMLLDQNTINDRATKTKSD